MRIAEATDRIAASVRSPPRKSPAPCSSRMASRKRLSKPSSDSAVSTPGCPRAAVAICATAMVVWRDPLRAMDQASPKTYRALTLMTLEPGIGNREWGNEAGSRSTPFSDFRFPIYGSSPSWQKGRFPDQGRGRSALAQPPALEGQHALAHAPGEVEIVGGDDDRRATGNDVPEQP